MGIEGIRDRIERRETLGPTKPPSLVRRSRTVSYDRSLDVAEAAQAHERVAGDGAAEAVPAVLVCMTSTFESLANSMLMMRGLVLRSRASGAADNQADRLAQLLFAINQNLRLAAHASDIGCRDDEPAPWDNSRSLS